MNVEDRYNRQELIDGWNQDALSDARAVVIGSGVLAHYTLVGIAALGIGTIEIYSEGITDRDYKNTFLHFQSGSRHSQARSLEHILSRINKESGIKGMHFAISHHSAPVLGKPDVILDLTNNVKSKTVVASYAAQKDVPFITGTATNDVAKISIMHDKKVDISAFAHSQGVVTSGIAGGIIVEELRKLLMPLSESDKPINQLMYTLSSPNRFMQDQGTIYASSDVSLEPKRTLIVGAGALGNFVALGAALSGIGNIDIMDFDMVDSTNLNRQFLFYDAIGQEKSTALAKKISEINPSITARGIVTRLDEHTDYFLRNTPDIIFDCVDSFAVRAYINYFGVRYGIPVVSGGTNPRSGQVVVYNPSQSACLDCKLGVENALAEEREAASCKFAPDPSVIMTNQVVGNMMVGEALKVLDSAYYGNPVTRILKYDSTVSVRGGLVGASDPCSCSKPEDIQQWLRDIDGKKD